MAERVKRQVRRRGYTRVSDKHQITLPMDVLATAGVRAGDRLKVEAQRNGEIILRLEEDPIDRFAGVFDGMYPAGYLDELRDEWR